MKTKSVKHFFCKGCKLMSNTITYWNTKKGLNCYCKRCGESIPEFERSGKVYSKVCVCGKKFNSNSPIRIYCSPDCKYKANYKSNGRNNN